MFKIKRLFAKIALWRLSAEKENIEDEMSDIPEFLDSCEIPWTQEQLLRCQYARLEQRKFKVLKEIDRLKDKFDL